MLCTSGPVECGVSGAAHLLDRCHVHIEDALNGPRVGTWCVGAMLKCWVRHRSRLLCAVMNLLDMHLEKLFGPRVEELLRKALFPLLKAAKRVAAKAQKDSKMSEVENE